MKKITDGDLKKLIGVRGKPRLVPVGACVWLKVSMNARGETSKRWLTRYYEKGKPIKRIIGSFPELSALLPPRIRRPWKRPRPWLMTCVLRLTLLLQTAR